MRTHGYWEENNRHWCLFEGRRWEEGQYQKKYLLGTKFVTHVIKLSVRQTPVTQFTFLTNLRTYACASKPKTKDKKGAKTYSKQKNKTKYKQNKTK